MSNKEVHSPKIWISLDTIEKYLKGNLLGEKKREVEDKIKTSAFISDAVSGFKSIDSFEKTEKSINELNRQIALKSGSSKTTIYDLKSSIPDSATSTTSEKKSFVLPQRTILTIAATAIILLTSALAIWYYQYQSTSKNNDDLVKSEPAKSIEEKNRLPKSTIVASDKNKNDSLNEINSADTAAQIAELNVSKNLSAQSELSKKEESATNAPQETKSSVPSSDDEKIAVAKSEPEERQQKDSSQQISEKKKALEESEEISLSEDIENANQIESDSAEKKEYSSSYSKTSTKELSRTNSNYEQALQLKKQGEIKEAIDVLEEVTKDESSEYYDDALWEIGQLEASLNNRRRAKRALKDIPEGSKFYEQAQKKLEEL